MRDAFISQIDREQLPAEAARRWSDEPVALTHVQDSENFVFRFQHGHTPRPCFLRLTHAGHRSLSQLSAELDFIRYLTRHGYHASPPVPSRRGNLIETLSTDDADFYACVFEAAPGAHVGVGSSDWGEALFEEWGRSLAALHVLSRRYAPARPRRYRWDEDDVLVNAATYIPPGETSALRAHDEVMRRLSELPTGRGFGLIHGDLCRVNFNYDGRRITAFDFDDCCYHWFVYDLVCALAPASFRPPEERRAYRGWMVGGYGRLLPLGESWQSDFDLLLRLRHVYLFALHLRNWGGAVEQHPKRELLERLRHSFEHPFKW
jgi:Ser/Thr protein kinase RdoA (MazF antagonist)